MDVVLAPWLAFYFFILFGLGVRNQYEAEKPTIPKEVSSSSHMLILLLILSYFFLTIQREF